MRGPNPRLPKHAYRYAGNVGDIDGDSLKDQGTLDVERSEAHYSCGGDTPYCVQQYLAVRLAVRSASGRTIFDYGGGWIDVATSAPYSDTTYGWVGDWNHDRRGDVFEADPSGVYVFALTRAGLRRNRLGVFSPPAASRPYVPISLDVNADGRAELIGAGIHRDQLALVVVSPR